MEAIINNENYLEDLKGKEIKLKNFRDLRAYQIASDLAEECRKIADSLPEIEKYILSDQLRRSVSKIPAQVGEGNGQLYKKEEIRFYSIALGSLSETQAHLELCLRSKYIEEEKFKELDNKAMQIKALVITYIQKLINS